MSKTARPRNLEVPRGAVSVIFGPSTTTSWQDEDAILVSKNCVHQFSDEFHSDFLAEASLKGTIKDSLLLLNVVGQFTRVNGSAKS